MIACAEDGHDGINCFYVYSAIKAEETALLWDWLLADKMARELEVLTRDSPAMRLSGGRFWLGVSARDLAIHPSRIVARVSQKRRFG